jgi:hypothetical protein
MNDPGHRWNHIRIRAESSGVALNAHSAGVSEVDVRGLKALTQALANSAVAALGHPVSQESLDAVENSLLRTLIQEWGTNSYEFSLEGLEKPSQVRFRAHCYFGLRTGPTQDSLQHLKCYARYGGNLAAKDFLMQHAGGYETAAF